RRRGRGQARKRPKGSTGLEPATSGLTERRRVQSPRPLSRYAPSEYHGLSGAVTSRPTNFATNVRAGYFERGQVRGGAEAPSSPSPPSLAPCACTPGAARID